MHLLAGWVARWRASRPPTGGQFTTEQRSDVSCVGPIDWLATESRRHDPDGRGVSPSTIDRIISRRAARVTELRTADALVSAMGCPEAFHDGTLEIRRNPLASSAAQAACCGSAPETGSMISDGFWESLAACVRPNQLA